MTSARSCTRWRWAPRQWAVFNDKGTRASGPGQGSDPKRGLTHPPPSARPKQKQRGRKPHAFGVRPHQTFSHGHPRTHTDTHGRTAKCFPNRLSIKVRAVRGKKTRYSHGPTRTKTDKKSLILVFSSVPSVSSVAKLSFFYLFAAKNHPHW